jgi:hypothetical protein
MNVNKLISQLKHAAAHHRPVARTSTAMQLGTDLVVVVKNVGHPHHSNPKSKAVARSSARHVAKPKHKVKKHHKKHHPKKTTHHKAPRVDAIAKRFERKDEQLRAAAASFLKSPLVKVYAGDRSGMFHAWEGWSGVQGKPARTVFDEVIATHGSTKL